ncbi:alpha/beta hydrolase [Aquisalibacillus elongatus]|uniref:Phospholipase/carboxylesterase n=1 Tax=Aquisalibacillus elongatus TaxID=485577 RepID=A0A3N5C180_9BACI|nr:alpha/beta hydrolase [Aquisalibacillus elongatus]RPF55828.1 phospholipase/carboxylesterase [Aquisalibacillus elongatus]
MKHVFKEGQSNRTLLLLHGTGGNEEDLLPLADMIDQDANILSVRGSVNENGMNRFFKRHAEGVFDEEDLIERTKELNQFLDDKSNEYGFDRNEIYAVGYSNGANIAGSMLFHYNDSLKAAMLFHPMVPRRGIQLPDQQGVNVFIGAGENDPICPAQEAQDLKSLLESANVDVELFWTNMGHQLTREEVEAAKAWYQKL